MLASEDRLKIQAGVMGARRETGRTAMGGKRISFVRAPLGLSREWCDALEVRSLM